MGIPLATLAEQLGANPAVTEAIVEASGLSRIGPEVALSHRRIELTDSQRTQRKQIRSRIGADLAVPSVKELDADRELLHLMIREGDLIRISNDLLLLPEQVEAIKRTLVSLPGQFTVAQFRDATSLSRKYAVPILEWMDMEGLTVRRGDSRSAR